MRDFYLRFDFQSEAEEFLENEALDPSNFTVDVVGAVWSRPVFDGDTIVEPAEPQSGYHVNVRSMDGTCPTAFDPYRTNPDTPFRVFA